MYDLGMIKKESVMIKKQILKPDRVRSIDGGFSFIPHRFLADGFLTSLSQKEILLYLFLILVSDRHGLSFYSYDSICSLLQITADEYIDARNALIKKDLIAFDGSIFQVLDLPPKPIKSFALKKGQPTVAQLIQLSLKEANNGWE